MAHLPTPMGVVPSTDLTPSQIKIKPIYMRMYAYTHADVNPKSKYIFEDEEEILENVRVAMKNIVAALSIKEETECFASSHFDMGRAIAAMDKLGGALRDLEMAFILPKCG